MTTPRVSIVGIHGHGRSHLDGALRAHREGRIRLVGVADPAGPAEALPEVTRHFDDSTEMFDAAPSDIAIVSTPIHTHAAIAIRAVEAGNDVLLEKPPTATFEEFGRLTSTADAHGRLVQVGFQSLGSDALPYMKAVMESGTIGEVVRYSASAGWVRPQAYWRRADWAGRRTMHGRVVADGVLTNPLAHATATALTVASAADAESVTAVELDLHRANDIQADDTSVAILTLADGARLTTAVTLCAPSREEPFVEVVGTKGRLVFYYAVDIVQLFGPRDDGLPHTTRHSRTSLLDDLIAARSDRRGLLSPLAASGGFTRLLQAVQDAPEPSPVAPEFVTWVDDTHGSHPVIHEIMPALRSSIRESATFRDLGLPWATRGTS